MKPDEADAINREIEGLKSLRERIVMKRDNERKALVVVYWLVLLLGAGFMLYSTHATCTSKLAPAHKYCTD